MKKTCVFICGTNCTGKTTVAKALQARFGGIRATTSDTTYCNDSRACFAGRYKTDGKHGGVDVLNRKIKAPFIHNMRDLCKEVGMRFYVSDAHFKELCCNGSCCGLPADWNYSKGQFCEALQIAKQKGVVYYSDIRKDIEELHSGYDWGKATGFNANSSEKRAQFYGMSMADYMRWLWNNPQAGQSPYKLFEGVLQPVGKDGEGNIIYKYNTARTF